MELLQQTVFVFSLRINHAKLLLDKLVKNLYFIYFLWFFVFRSKRPLIIAGHGAVHAAESVRQLALKV